VAYTYRNLPSTGLTWAVSGLDGMTGSAGILEWCDSRDDAEDIRNAMLRDVRRFESVTIVNVTKEG
jgi:hypothetical protein